MPKKKLVYILSPSFSGSTLLTLLLARHEKIATIGELKATARGDLETYECSCGERLLDCAFWSEIRQSVLKGGTTFDLNDFGTHFCADNFLIDRVLGAQVRGDLFELVRKLFISKLPPIKRQFNAIMRQNATLISLIQEKLNADYFLDGSKDPNRLLYLMESGNWDIFVINVTRDGRAQSNSQRSRPHYTGSYRDAAKEWNKTMRQIKRVCSRVSPEKSHTMSYESLCHETENTLDQIWSFLKLPSIPCDSENLNLKTTEQHILGNKMRTKSSITIRLDERWKNQITKSEYEEFDQIAGATNKSLGY